MWGERHKQLKQKGKTIEIRNVLHESRKNERTSVCGDCPKCDLWHEILRFCLIRKETANSSKQSELLLLLEEFFDMSNYRAKCWILYFNNHCKKCKSWKDVHYWLVENKRNCQLLYCKLHQTQRNWDNHNIAITSVLLSRSQEDQQYSSYLKTQGKQKNSRKERVF